MKRLATTLLTLCLLLPTLSANDLTTARLESLLGSQVTFSRAEVAEILKAAVDIFEQEIDAARADILAKHAEEVSALKQAFALELGWRDRERVALKVIVIGETALVVGYGGLKLFGVIK